MADNDKQQQVFFQKKYYKNIVDPIYLVGCYTKIIPRYYRYKKRPKKDSLWYDYIFEERQLCKKNKSGEIIGGRFPIFENDEGAKSLCAIRYVNHADIGYSVPEGSFVFFDIYADVPFFTDELFRAPESKDDVFETVCFRSEDQEKLRSMIKGKVQISETKNAQLDELLEPSICVEFPVQFLRDIDKLNRFLCDVSGYVSLTVDNIVERYKGPKKNSRIILADDIVIYGKSETTENIIVQSRNEDIKEKKGMPVKISVDYSRSIVRVETLEKDVKRQIKYGCDFISDCKKCEYKQCMRLGTMCSWTVEKVKFQKKNLLARLVFSKEEFIKMFSKIIYFSERLVV